jgi:hypothetical protein
MKGIKKNTGKRREGDKDTKGIKESKDVVTGEDTQKITSLTFQRSFPLVVQ